MKIWFSLFFILSVVTLNGQVNLTMTGKTYTNTQDTWEGVNIPRSEKTAFVFSNNSITSKNRYGYMLQAGDESSKRTNNNLDGAVITGNKFKWTGSDMTIITHGLFTGHNSNIIAKYNYLDNVPMGIIRKSTNNMTNTGGGVAYNIVKNGAVQFVVKGMSNVNIYNNTFYTERTTSQTWRPLIHIYTNTDAGRYSVAHGTKIYNNIFYTKYQTLSITVADNESLVGLECDYNIYWCENGSPRFSVNGKVISFEQWQAMGYDTHSVVMNPDFVDLVNFAPSRPLDLGRDMGDEWRMGLAADAIWGTTDPATCAQGSKWQIGAVVLATAGDPAPVPSPSPSPDPSPAPAPPVYSYSVVEDASPSKIEINYNTSLLSTAPPETSFTARINGVVKIVEDVIISGSKVILVISGAINKGDAVTVSYSRPAANPLQSEAGGQAESFAEKNVTNNVKSVDVPVEEPEADDAPEEINPFYPNPASGELNLDVMNPRAGLVRTIRIFDLSGKLCIEKELVLEEKNKIPLNLRPGLYIVRLETGKEVTLVQKMVIVE